MSMICPNDPTRHCDPTCASSSESHCALHGASHCGTSTLSLTAALQQFEKEAVLGEVNTGRYRCRYFTWGSGPPLTFIHGLGDLARSFVMPMALLSRSFRCIGYDLPNGRDDGARLRGYSHPNLVADLFALLDGIGLEKSYLFGSSFGSTIALAAMHERPERIPRTLLQGGFAHRRLSFVEALLCRGTRYFPGSLRHMPLRRRTLSRTHGRPFKGRTPDLWEYFLRLSGSIPLSVAAHRGLMLHQLDLRSLLPQIRQPTLMICGDDDPLVDHACERALLEGLPLVHKVEIAGCGHYPYFTHPEVLAELVRDFLTPRVRGSNEGLQ